MKIRKLRIRTKFIGILIIAAVVPLCIALVAAQLLGYRYYRKAQGTLFQTRAEEIARSLSVAVEREVETLDDWLALSGLAEKVAALPEAFARAGSEARAQVAEMESRWPALSAADPMLQPFLQGELAEELRSFQAVHPLFAELILTNETGALLAATAKTSDYWQADEKWWQRAIGMGYETAYIEGINYDASAGVHSIDIAMPVKDWRGSGPPRGVIKGVLNAAPLLTSTRSMETASGALHEIIIGDGRILARLAGGEIEPLREKIPPAVAERIADKGFGWMVAELDENGGDDLAGFARVRLTDREVGREVGGVAPMFVLVRGEASVVLAPVRKQMLMVGIAGAAIVLGFALAGYYIATRKIIEPIEALRTSVQAIAASAQLEEGSPAPARALPALEPLGRIRTGDELQNLAHDFAAMAERVLTYHDRLEAEIALKTAEIERDLQIAREFQEALMPRAYPKVPSDGHADSIRLSFQHIYKPASSVGGDFFDVLKLSDHRAGVFIADVMGHGARSALVTAILRALLQNLAYRMDDPSQFLDALNRHFTEIVRESGETIFVSAFYLIIDTETSTASYASAGHPSPFVADRDTYEVMPLVPGRANAALGLFGDSQYTKWERPVKSGDVFLLFTDGVHEAYNAAGEEFGPERIREVIRSHIEDSGSGLGRAIVNALTRFIHPATPADDICLVTVEVSAIPAKKERAGKAAATSLSQS